MLAVLLAGGVVVAPPPTPDLVCPTVHACLTLGAPEQCVEMAARWRCRVVHVPSLDLSAAGPVVGMHQPHKPPEYGEEHSSG